MFNILKKSRIGQSVRKLCRSSQSEPSNNVANHIAHPYCLVNCQGRELSVGNTDELQHFQNLGALYREQTEFAAARCCEILGIDSEIDSLERDWANEIVLHGTDPLLAIKAINRHRKVVS